MVHNTDMESHDVTIIDDSGVRYIATINFKVDDIIVGETVQGFENTMTENEIRAACAKAAELFFAERSAGLSSTDENVQAMWGNQFIDQLV